jgi:hypothetical protein
MKAFDKVLSEGVGVEVIMEGGGSVDVPGTGEMWHPPTASWAWSFFRTACLLRVGMLAYVTPVGKEVRGSVTAARSGCRTALATTPRV